MHITLTFVAAADPLRDQYITDFMRRANIHGDIVWLDHDKAAEVTITHRQEKSLSEKARAFFAPYKIDVFITPSENRRKKLILADMDSTIVTTETLDELAVFAGLHDVIAAITERSMRGELDFNAALKERVHMLKGLKEEAMQKTLAQTQLMPGAKTLVQTMAKHGATCVLVSGGFTFFTGPIAQQAGFHHHHGNTLLLNNGALTGEVAEPILDKTAKLDFLRRYCTKLGIDTADAMTIGDGANDLPMLQAAGLGVGYHPKPVVKNEIENCVLYGDLTAALYAQGYTAKDFAI